MKFKFIIFAIFSFLLTTDCKEKSTENEFSVDSESAFLIGFTGIDNFLIFKDYKYESEIILNLPRDSEIIITGFYKIKKNQNIYEWIKISTKEIIGFVPASYIQNQRLILFNQLTELRNGVILASSLRVREKPFLNSKVITNLPKNSLVQILNEGTTLQTIEGRTDKWVQIKTDDGKIGFSFKGFIQDMKENNFYELYDGYIELNHPEMKYWLYPEKVLIKEPVPTCKMSLKSYPKKGSILKVSGKQSIGSKTYYKMEHHNFG